MTRPRRKKILIWILLIILLLVALGYAFRYPLIRKYQYWKLESLHCTDSIRGLDATNGDCLNRIWAHRVNTIERYEILKDNFHGFEMDIVYDDSKQIYYVYHPPKPEGELLTLKDFFSKVDFEDSLIHRMFWLDIRGVDSSNMKRALEAFANVILSIRDANENSSISGYDFILEMYDMTSAGFFAENGMFVSYDPSERLLQRMITDSLFRDSVNTVLGRVPFVSQDHHYVSFLKQFFPQKAVLTWRPEFEVFTNTEELQKLLDDPRIAYILVSIKSRYYK